MPQYCAIVVEGPHDKLFIERVILPHLNSASFSFDVLMSNNWSAADYDRKMRPFDSVIVLKDLDDDTCPARRKQQICRDYKLTSYGDKIVVVIKEIESWYLAGGSQNLKKLPARFHSPNSTANISKEDLKREVRRWYKWSHESTLQELASDYSFPNALRRNSSVGYFFRKIATITGADISRLA